MNDLRVTDLIYNKEVTSDLPYQGGLDSANAHGSMYFPRRRQCVLAVSASTASPALRAGGGANEQMPDPFAKLLMWLLHLHI